MVAVAVIVNSFAGVNLTSNPHYITSSVAIFPSVIAVVKILFVWSGREDRREGRRGRKGVRKAGVKVAGSNCQEKAKKKKKKTEKVSFFRNGRKKGEKAKISSTPLCCMSCSENKQKRKLCNVVTESPLTVLVSIFQKKNFFWL